MEKQEMRNNYGTDPKPAAEKLAFTWGGLYEGLVTLNGRHPQSWF